MQRSIGAAIITITGILSVGVLAYGYQYYFNPGKTVSSTQPPIKITSPRGDEVWNMGETHTITWTSHDVQTVDIKAQDNGPGEITIATDIPASAGSYSWTIPNTVRPGSDWSVSVWGNSNTSYGNYGNTISGITIK